MYSLIVTIIAVGLTMALASSTMYYTGSAANQGNVAVTALTLINQAKQVRAAVEFREFKTTKLTLTSVTELQAEDYLTSIPVPPERSYSTGLSPLATDWSIAIPAPAPAILIREKIREDVCLKFNELLTNRKLISESIDVTRSIQCFGVKEPYTIVINPSRNTKVLEALAENLLSIVEIDSREITLATASLPEGRVGYAYNYNLKPLYRDSSTTNPDMSTVTWSVTPDLPEGLTLDATTGVISGRPKVPTTDSVYTVTAKSRSISASQVYNLYIRANLKVAHAALGGTTCFVTLFGAVLCTLQPAEATELIPGYSGVPPLINLKSGIRDVSVGGRNQCAITIHNTVKCWGTNTVGELGDGTYVNKIHPVDVLNLTNVRSISVGFGVACAVTYEDALYCWGKIGYKTYNTPTIIHGFDRGVATVSAAPDNDRICIINTDGEVLCWGRNNAGQVGNGTRNYQATPYKVPGIPEKVSQLVAGKNHTCAVTINNALYCWGLNSMSQLAYQTRPLDYSTVPGMPDIPKNVKSVAVSAYHTCVLTLANSVTCWGQNNQYYESGNLGIGYYSVGGVKPSQVLGLESGVKALFGGGAANCVIKDNDDVYCWGLFNSNSTVPLISPWPRPYDAYEPRP